MDEYIKRDTVINHLDACMDTIWKPEIVALKCFVEGIPAADVAPVQQGQRIAEGEEQNDRRKSMGRLISADALIKNHFSDEHNIALSYANKIWMRQIINAEPTVDAVPRELFDKLLKDMCEMCFMWGDGLCPFCKWKEYRMEHDLWVRAVNELCRACPFTACPGQTKCVRLAERIVEMKEELRGQT